MKDLFGKAILDFQTHNSPEDLITETNISEADEMDVAYLFRDFKSMPKLEQKALQLAKGKVLDVGCGAGSHGLYLQEKGFDVKDPDRSWAILYKKQLLDKYSINYPKNVPYLEDGLFLAKVFTVASKVGFDNQIFYQPLCLLILLSYPAYL